MTLTAGQKHREREAARSRRQSRSVRDIAPMPPIQNPARRRAARRSLRTFCETYFPEKFGLPWASYHLKVIARLEKVILKGGKVALALPRGSGKTTLTLASAVWALLFGFRRFVVLVGANKEEAVKLLNFIKSSLSNNQKLCDDFPEVVYPIMKLGGSALLARGQLYIGSLTNIHWKGLAVTLPTITGSPASGSRVAASGIFGAIRGKSVETTEGETIRPDLVLIDDPQTDESARSAVQIAKAEEIINKAICGLAGPGIDIAVAMPCPVIHESDLADRYLNHKIYPRWRGIRYKAIETMPDRMDLWKEYAELRKEGGDETAFYLKHRDAMR